MLEYPGIARLLIELPIGFRRRDRSHQTVGVEILDRLRPFSTHDELTHPFGIDAGINYQMGTWIFFGPSSRAIDCATARNPNLALANAAKPGPPRKLAVAPVKKIFPLPRPSIKRGLPAGEKARVASHFPHLAENPLGGVHNRKKDANLQLRMFVGIAQEGNDFVF